MRRERRFAVEGVGRWRGRPGSKLSSSLSAEPNRGDEHQRPGGDEWRRDAHSALRVGSKPALATSEWARLQRSPAMQRSHGITFFERRSKSLAALPWEFGRQSEPHPPRGSSIRADFARLHAHEPSPDPLSEPLGGKVHWPSFGSRTSAWVEPAAGPARGRCGVVKCAPAESCHRLRSYACRIYNSVGLHDEKQEGHKQAHGGGGHEGDERAGGRTASSAFSGPGCR